MEIISFKYDLAHLIFCIDIWKWLVATVFPVHEYPIQHGLLWCGLVKMVFVSEIFSCKDMYVHMSVWVSAHINSPSRPSCYVFYVSRGVACSQPGNGSVSGCVLRPQTSPHHPANALSHLTMIRSAAYAGEPSVAPLSAPYAFWWIALISDDQQKVYKWHFWTYERVTKDIILLDVKMQVLWWPEVPSWKNLWKFS